MTLELRDRGLDSSSSHVVPFLACRMGRYVIPLLLSVIGRRMNFAEESDECTLQMWYMTCDELSELAQRTFGKVFESSEVLVFQRQMSQSDRFLEVPFYRSLMYRDLWKLLMTSV